MFPSAHEYLNPYNFIGMSEYSQLHKREHSPSILKRKFSPPTHVNLDGLAHKKKLLRQEAGKVNNSSSRQLSAAHDDPSLPKDRNKQACVSNEDAGMRSNSVIDWIDHCVLGLVASKSNAGLRVFTGSH